MKIGTITFHWAVNYGAVLQAYALQRYLINKGYETEIIDYRPLLVIAKQNIDKILKFDYKYFIKYNKMREFQNKHLLVSSRKFSTNKALKKNCLDYDVYICGSDQIWNHSFTMKAEGKPCLSYFLNFVPINKKRISYAASFGADSLNEDLKQLVKPELEEFNGISVREFTGTKIVDDLNLESYHVLDPTLLLTKGDYEELLFDENNSSKDMELFSYIIHQNQINAEKVNRFISKKYFNGKYINHGQSTISIQEWINNIRNSKFVVTNSYHGVIFSVIFNKPFIVVSVEGVPMNNRIETILGILNLSNRVVSTFDEELVTKVYNQHIDWGFVEERINKYRMNSIQFIDNMLNS